MLNNLLLGQTAEEKLYVEDVFSTYLYTGNGSTQTITNEIDLAGKGGMVWLKYRSGTPKTGYEKHMLFDTQRSGASLSTDNTAANETGWSSAYFRFNADGFDTGTGTGTSQEYLNKSGVSYASWTFRKAAKFFDVLTWTGDGSGGSKTVSHALGTAPGMVIIKKTSDVENWTVWHRSLSTNEYLELNTTAAKQTLVGVGPASSAMGVSPI